jgi:recombination protein RecR
MNPLEGITQDDIKIVELISRLSNVREVILALNPSVEGELTTHYLAKLIKPFDISVSRIASGLPMGSSLEFSDDATIARAIEGRIQI